MMLRDHQFEGIAPLLLGRVEAGGDRRWTTGSCVKAVLGIARTGSPWHDLPVEFGGWNSVYKRFARWSQAGIWHGVFAELASDADFDAAELFDECQDPLNQMAGAVEMLVQRTLFAPICAAWKRRPSAGSHQRIKKSMSVRSRPATSKWKVGVGC